LVKTILVVIIRSCQNSCEEAKKGSETLFPGWRFQSEDAKGVLIQGRENFRGMLRLVRWKRRKKNEKLRQTLNTPPNDSRRVEMVEGK